MRSKEQVVAHSELVEREFVNAGPADPLDVGYSTGVIAALRWVLGGEWSYPMDLLEPAGNARAADGRLRTPNDREEES
jgi:hypothetical protein